MLEDRHALTRPRNPGGGCVGIVDEDRLALTAPAGVPVCPIARSPGATARRGARGDWDPRHPLTTPGKRRSLSARCGSSSFRRALGTCVGRSPVEAGTGRHLRAGGLDARPPAACGHWSRRAVGLAGPRARERDPLRLPGCNLQSSDHRPSAGHAVRDPNGDPLSINRMRPALAISPRQPRAAVSDRWHAKLSATRPQCQSV